MKPVNARPNCQAYDDTTEDDDHHLAKAKKQQNPTTIQKTTSVPRMRWRVVQ